MSVIPSFNDDWFLIRYIFILGSETRVASLWFPRVTRERVLRPDADVKSVVHLADRTPARTIVQRSLPLHALGIESRAQHYTWRSDKCRTPL
jgi:hypothetical protein